MLSTNGVSSVGSVPRAIFLCRLAAAFALLLLLAPRCEALLTIYEGFAYDVTNGVAGVSITGETGLGPGETPALGLTGAYTSVSDDGLAGSDQQFEVATGSLSFGTLTTSGNHTVRGVAARFSNLSRGIDPLVVSPLTANGAEIWLSYLWDPTLSNSASPNGQSNNGFALASTTLDLLANATIVNNTERGVGMRVTSTAMDATIFGGGVSTDPVNNVLSSGKQVHLILGRVRWGATATALDTIDLFILGNSAAIPALIDLDQPSSRVTGVVDNSIIDTFTLQSNDRHRFDEFRVAVGQGGETSANLLAQVTPGLSISIQTPGVATLRVNVTTGQVEIVNLSNAAIDLAGYELASAAGSLNPTGWSSLQQQNLPGFPAGNGSGNGWEPLGLPADYNNDGQVDAADYTLYRDSSGASVPSGSGADGNSNGLIDAEDYSVWGEAFGDSRERLMGEAYLLGSSALAINGTVSLGSAFRVSATQDLSAKLLAADGTVITASVVYVGANATAVTVAEPSSGVLLMTIFGAMGLISRQGWRRAVAGIPPRLRLLLGIGIVFAFGGSREALAAPDRTRPNIVMMYVDDMGIGDTSAYSDLGVNDAVTQTSTPNIERLADAGLRFTDVHTAAAVCSPSRYALLAGRYSFRSDLKQQVLFTGTDDERTLFTQGGFQRSTVGDMLQRVGYQTYGIGKWHIGMELDTSYQQARTIIEGPTHVGFNHYTGEMGNPGGKGTLMIDNTIVKFASTDPNDRTTVPLGPGDTPETNWVVNNDGGELQHSKLAQWHLDASKSYLQTHAAGGANETQPFFLYYASHANHTPYYGPTSITTDGDGTPTVVPITGATLSGSPIVVQTTPDGNGDGLPDPNDPRFDADDLNDWALYYKQDGQGNQIDNPAAARARTVQENDVILGDLMDYLQATDDPRNPGGKLIDNTLIIFSSDNGADMDGPGPGGLLQESTNTPVGLAGKKGTSWEGGTRVPFVAAWAGMIPTGGTSDALFGQVDLYATLAEVTAQQLETPHPRAEAGDSQSVLDALLGQATGVVRDTDLIYKRKERLVIRRGDYKLEVFETDYAGDASPRLDPGGLLSGLDFQDLEVRGLWNLANDLGESTNLVNDSSQAALIASMLASLRKSIGPDSEQGFSRGVVGDFDYDGNLTANDWNILKRNFGAQLGQGASLAAYRRGDIDGDFSIGLGDIADFRTIYDLANGSGAFVAMAHAVPEPATIGLVVIAGLGALLRWGRNER